MGESEAEGRRQEIAITVFGSFRGSKLNKLKAVVSYLRSNGYGKARILAPSGHGKKLTDQEVLTYSEREAVTVEKAIIVFCRGKTEENQSAMIELLARLERLEEETGERPSPGNTILLVQEGVDMRSLLRGKLSRHRISTAEWKTQTDLNEACSAFLRGGIGEREAAVAGP